MFLIFFKIKDFFQTFFHKKNSKHLRSFVFVFGFIFDWFTLPSIYSSFYIWIGPFYIITLIFLLKIRYSRLYLDTEIDKINFVYLKKILKYIYYYFNKYITLIISFFLGSLLSYIFIYYFKNTEIFLSWPIILFIAIAIFANEFLNNKISDYLLFFIALTFYFIFNVPIFYKDVNQTSFMISLLLSSVVGLLFIYFINIKNKIEKIISYVFSILFPFILFLLYFSNQMPAVPLFLKEKSFYASIIKDNNTYIKLPLNSHNIALQNYIYFYSSIVSPLDVKANVSHDWYKYSKEEGDWILISSIKFVINGGRQDGYRGYTYIKSRGAGEYKVIVKAGDMIIGQKKITLY